MTGALAWIAVAVVLCGCQSPFAKAAPKPVTPQSIVVQPGDLPSMQRCAISGDVNAVLNDEKARNSPDYDRNATEWEQWKQQGAVAAYFAVYGLTRADCDAASDASTGAPQGRLMVGLVVQFRDVDGAARNFQRESTLLGLGPRDIRFIELAGGTTTFGSATGLGVDSVVGSALVAGANYFVAMWQSNRFQSEFIGYDMTFADADAAVMDVNKRIPQG
ncbi:MAG TPA: hypothetical protein VFB69_02380 [Candidatus Dormibacteraeota bacterium]|nr:hypothetical protein [Candidatus Dormibacteraeota bacterium]